MLHPLFVFHLKILDAFPRAFCCVYVYVCVCVCVCVCMCVCVCERESVV